MGKWRESEKERRRGRTVGDDLATHENECQDDMQYTEHGELICAVPCDETPVRTRAGISTIDVIWRICSLGFENAFVCQRRAFNEYGIQRRTKDVRLGTLRDSWRTIRTDVHLKGWERSREIAKRQRT